MKILVTCNLDGSAVAELRQRHDVTSCETPGLEQLCAAVADREVVVMRSGISLSEDVLTAAPDLRLVVRAGAGLDNIDLEAAAARGVRVTRIPGVSAPAVAEMTFALLLALARNVVVADRALRAGHWPKSHLGGALLAGKTWGVVGAGKIGGLVGEMAHRWGMSVLGCVSDPTETVRDRLAARGIRLAELGTVVAEADFLSVHVPLDASTRHLFDADLLDRMKPGSLLVNMARGGVVDEKALAEALRHGRSLAGAALDVHESEGEGTCSPLADLDNVVLTPHIGAMAVDVQRLIGRRVVDLVDAFASGELEREVRDDELVL